MPIAWDSGEAPDTSAWGAAIGKAGSVIDSKAIETTKAETQKLVEAASTGGFRISEEGVKPLRAALSNMQTRLDELSSNTVRRLGQAPKLGSHEYGQTVAAHDQKGGANELGSASIVLDQLAQVLSDADTALARAAGIYKENEATTADGMNVGQA
ncbi:hypothetical protein DI005_16465 [Prauserella sp. PE36]|uniref:hypothetical protein n=1 Tax=Prauserella sp. PE36 TaxID=1504709 RepID=UPI000DE1AE26|nr:hypothetical protein [Prauserella sp. PE36]RBM19275.1 hypothetical protein DI005_16465 [Prauserella sp. PE36]